MTTRINSKKFQYRFKKALLNTTAIITVAELFAGVGGFRIGLEGYSGKSATSNYKDDLKSPYHTIWSNQYEPSTKNQIASEIYQSKFGIDGHINKDIATISTCDIPNTDLFVGGFPCQDYSVANNRAGGLQGKKAYCGGRYTG